MDQNFQEMKISSSYQTRFQKLLEIVRSSSFSIGGEVMGLL